MMVIQRMWSSLLLVVLCISMLVSSNAVSTFTGCGGSGITFTTFTLFPNPVPVDTTIHARAVINLSAPVSNGSLTLIVNYNIDDEASLSIPAIDLCSLSSVRCPLSAGQHAISFDFYVPQIPEGVYTIRYSVFANNNALSGCIAFNVTVKDPSQAGYFTSWFTAQLLGTAHFQNSDYTKRTLRDFVQVGPVGYVSPAVGNTFTWGTFGEVQGSADLVPSFFNTAGYVWGLYGNITNTVTNPPTYIQTYKGTILVGYSLGGYVYNTAANNLFMGDFTLNFTYTQVQGVATTLLNGFINLPEEAVIPRGWGNVISFGRLTPLAVQASNLGTLTVSANTTYCASVCPGSFLQEGSNNSKKLTTADYALIFSLIFGVTALVAVGAATWIYMRKRQKAKDEDNIFATSRKTPYGGALVVDDIIQETKDTNGTLLERDDDLSTPYSSEEEPRYSRSESESRQSESRDEESDDDVSSHGSRNRNRSRSKEGRRRTGYLSHSRSRSRSRTPSEDYDDSRSRQSESEDESDD